MTPPLSDSAVVRINVFWFVSLCLSLSAALVGILCKQWLREYERDVGRSPEKALAVRHIRLHGLEYWKVGTIVASVPIILQIALVSFFLGIIDLLWGLNAAVASCVTSIAALTLAFYLATTVLPLAQYAYICLRCCGPLARTDNYCALKAFTQPQCAFKSAQSWLALRVAQPAIEYCFKKYAASFTYHDPPRVYALVLSPAKSWITFDVNWTKRREHTHVGPSAAFESLAWIARHLEEADSSSWIWHCVRGRLLRNREDPRDISAATLDIGCVADAYPSLLTLGRDYNANIRAQSLSLRCSLRADLPLDTALEQILRLAPVVGVNSQWTREALNTVVSVYSGLSARLSDDVAIGLLHLAESQAREAIQGNAVDFPDDLSDRHLPFYRIAQLLYRSTHLRGRLLPIMCALALPWLEMRPHPLVQNMGMDLLSTVIDHYLSLNCNNSQLLASPGVLFVARLASAVYRIYSGLFSLWRYSPMRDRILQTLLALSAQTGSSSATEREVRSDEAPDLEHRAEVRDVALDHQMENANVDEDLDPALMRTETHGVDG